MESAMDSGSSSSAGFDRQCPWSLYYVLGQDTRDSGQCLSTTQEYKWVQPGKLHVRAT